MNLTEMIRQAVELVPEVKQYLDDAVVKMLRKRDKREPFRREKEATEEAIAELITKRFRRQLKKLNRLITEYTGRKTISPPIDMVFETDDEEEEFYARLVMLVTKAVRTGIGITAADISIGMDWTMTNAEAADFARKYAFDLVSKIDHTSRGILQNAVSVFVETPGMTLRDLADILPFGEQRAFTIAVTETTRAYAEGQVMAAQDVAKQFPGVTVMKRWYTNNDDRTCDLCSPLDGVEIPLDEPFYEPDGYNNGDPPLHVQCRCFMSTFTKIENI